MISETLTSPLRSASPQISFLLVVVIDVVVVVVVVVIVVVVVVVVGIWLRSTVSWSEGDALPETVITIEISFISSVAFRTILLEPGPVR